MLVTSLSALIPADGDPSPDAKALAQQLAQGVDAANGQTAVLPTSRRGSSTGAKSR